MKKQKGEKKPDEIDDGPVLRSYSDPEGKLRGMTYQEIDEYHLRERQKMAEKLESIKKEEAQKKSTRKRRCSPER